jgi:hypothetical protein
LGATSSFQIMNIWEGTRMLGLYFYNDLIPRIFPDLYFSMGIFFLAVTSGYARRKCVDWKKIFFFLIAGFTFSFIIYIFRAAWGPLYLSVSRYDVFPSLMVCMIYILLLHPFLKEKEAYFKTQTGKTILFCCAFLLVSYSGMLRYNKAKRVTSETFSTIQKFNIDLKETVMNYFNDNPDVQNLTLKDNMIYFAPLYSLLTRKGFYPYPTRYARPMSFYNQYVLPENIRTKITFGEITDQPYLDYVKADRWKGTFQSFALLVE